MEIKTLPILFGITKRLKKDIARPQGMNTEYSGIFFRQPHQHLSQVSDVTLNIAPPGVRTDI